MFQVGPGLAGVALLLTIEVDHGRFSIAGLMRSFQRWMVGTLDFTLENIQNKADLTPKESN